MVVQHNLTADNTNRNAGIINRQAKFSTERLTSGYRINHAADDASGLSISEQMRGQIRGLDRASQNCDDGHSLVSVADGALQEMSHVMNRIRELCVEAANDTNVSADREALQMEVDALTEEVDRICKQTEFNTMKIFQGAAETKKVASIIASGGNVPGFRDANNNLLPSGQDIPMQPIASLSNMNGYTLDFGWIDTYQPSPQAAWTALDNSGFTFNCTEGCNQKFTFKFDNSTTGFLDETPNVNVNNSGSQNSKVFTVGTAGYTNGQQFVTDLISYIRNHVSQNLNVGHANKVSQDGSKLTVSGGTGTWGFLRVGTVVLADVPTGVYFDYDLNIQSGSNANQLTNLFLPRLDAQILGMADANGKCQLKVSNNQLAGASIDRVDGMLDTINQYRAKLGAFSNRMEHASSNADNSSENIQGSESKLRDADMAKEMMDSSRVNILRSAGYSMMAQANRSLDGTLQLLQ